MPAAQFDENGNYVAGTPWSVVEQMRNGDDGSQQQNDGYANDDNGGGFFGALSNFFWSALSDPFLLSNPSWTGGVVLDVLPGT